MRTQLIYDGSFDGFLTSIYELYERKLCEFEIIRGSRFQPDLLSGQLNIVTDPPKARRVWAGLKKNLSAQKRNEVYKTFLSELPEMEQLLTAFIRYVFTNKGNTEEDLGNPSVIGVNKIAHQVHREKHRMEAFVRFQRTKDDLYFATIDPDFNVLPLIVSHFKDRYADQNWLIYDNRRNYGINYECAARHVSEVQVNLSDEASHEFLPAHLCHEDEVQYQSLWKDYFDSVNIGSRKNVKLHVRHVPTRYWKYLVEKRITT